MNKAFKVEKETAVTKDTEGVYVWWNVESESCYGLSSKIVSDTFYTNTVYLRLDGDLIAYPTDIKTIRAEPEDGWWVVRFDGGDQYARRKHGKQLYDVGADGFNRMSHWTEYEFIEKIAEPS